MTPDPAPFPLRKKTDLKVSLYVGILGCGVCLFLDWIVHGVTRMSHPISSAVLVPVLSLVNVCLGISVWRKVEMRQRWLVIWAVLASGAAMAFMPWRSGPLSGVNTLLWVLGITLCTFFAVPVQRLVIAVERDALKKTLNQ